MTISEERARRAAERRRNVAILQDRVKRLKALNMSNVSIANALGIQESSVRMLLREKSS